MRGRIHRLTAAVVVALCALGLDHAAAQPASVYTVARISVDVTAKDAVEAKKQALAEGEQRALRILLKRVAPFGAQERLPRVKADIVEDMLSGFSVRREAIAANRYIATLDFQFQPNAVRQLLRGYDIPITDERAPELQLLPVYLQDGKVQAGPRDLWRKAWLALDLSHALTPVKLLQPGAALDKATVDATLAGDQAAFQAFTRQYGTDRLVLAVAEVQPDGRLMTKFYGNDATGLIDLVRSDRVFGDDRAAAADRAANVALRVFESRWKIGHSPAGVDTDEAGGELTVNVAVEFSGMRQWQDIRSRLAQVPGVQSLNVDALSARSATVTFQFAGGADRLGQQLVQRGLALEDRGGTWVLHSN